MQGTWVRKLSETSSIAVVFVHGILSDEDCWRHPGGSYWPDLLSKHEPLRDIGIYAFSYNTNLFSGSYSLGDIVDSLNACLDLDGVHQARKIIFIAHSMGGIVARRYIVQRCDELVERGTEVGLFLIASPSLGSDYANWLSPIAKLMGHAQGQALRFCESNQWLNDLCSDFRNVLEREKLPIRGRELVEDQFIILKRMRFFKQVVPRFSAATYFANAYKVPLSDHFSIAKPANAQAIQHRMLCEFIEKIALQNSTAGQVREYGNGFSTSVGASEIAVIMGRIEEHVVGSEAVVALPCNEYFEDNCATDTRTALGVYISKHCAEQSSAFSEQVRLACKKQLAPGKQREKTKGVWLESHGPGKAIMVPDPSGQAAAISMISTTTQRAGQGLAARMSYVFDGVRELFELLADTRINEVVMPVLGAGHGGIEPRLALAGLVLALAESAKYGKDSQRRKKITIIVFQRSRHAPPDVARDLIRRTLEVVAEKP